MRIIIPICLVCLLITACGKVVDHGEAEDGILDLRDWDPARDGVITLDGEWHFWWKNESVARTVDVPSTWQAYGTQEAPITTSGYAKYSLVIQMSADYENLAIFLPRTFSACRISLEGKFLSEVGRFGKSLSTSQAAHRPVIVELPSPGSAFELVFEISNFRDRNGGLWMPVLLGSYEELVMRRQIDIGIELFQVGALLVIALFNLSMYFFQRDTASYLFLAIMAFGQLIYQIAAGTQFLPILLDIPWVVVYHLDMVTFALIPLTSILFVRTILNTDRRRILLYSFSVYSVLYVAFAIPAPTILVSRSTDLIQLVYAFVFAYTAVVVVLSLKKRVEGSRMFLLGYIFSGLANAHDFWKVIVDKTTYYTSLGPFGTILFFCCLSLLLSQRFARLFRRTRDLTVELQETNQAYANFVPVQFLEHLEREKITDIRLGDQRRLDMGILFTDIRAFTELSERMSEKENFDFINEYLAHMEPAIRENGGFVDKYIGDAIMALFPGSLTDGVRAAVDLQRRLKEFNESRETPIRAGCGLHYGSMMLGVVGAKNRMESTVISDAVNLASRLEGLTRVYGTQVHVSERIVTADDTNQVKYRFTDYVRVKGRSTPERVFEVLDASLSDTHALRIDSLSLFERAIERFYAREFRTARVSFEEILERDPGDRVAEIFRQRCLRLENDPPEKQWDGVVVMVEK